MVNFSEPDFTDLPGRRAVPRMYRRSPSEPQRIDVSVITPYYNTEAFFVETFVALQAQSLQNWEWIIVDDGSTDETSVQRLAAVAAQDERIKVIRQANAGPGAARNTGFRHTLGRYLCLLDSDDMFEPTYLEKCVWFLDSNPEFAFCNSYSVVFGDQNFLHAAGFERGKTHLVANSGPPISVIRRAAYEDCGGFDESIRFGHEDWDFWLAMARAGHWGYTLQEFLQWYRKRGGGRYEQIMLSGNVNAEFEALMRRKYAGLEQHFPEPSRRTPVPYETIASNWSVSNLLQANPAGRRILFLVPWMVTGGADRVNLELMAGLTGKGHDISVCATLLADHNWEHQFARITPDVFVLPNMLHPTDYPRFLAYLIRSRQIDTVLITGSTIGYQLLPYLRAVSPGVAFVDMCHVEEPHWLNGGHPRFAVGYQDLLDLNIVTTRHLAQWMQQRGADGSRIRVLYTGVRAPQPTLAGETRVRMRAELGIPADTPVIVFAGRICAQKRPALLAAILRAARDRGLKFQALVIGDGELKGELAELLSRYNLVPCVQMLGTMPHQRWLDVLAAADLLLMPSQYEGISIALLEAMAAGVVPVVAKVGGQEETVGQDAGLLIPHGDNELQDYVDAIGGLLADPRRLLSMSEQCRSFIAANHSWEGSIAVLQAYLDEAHQLERDSPRLPISPGLGRELAAAALETKRLVEAVDWLWRKSSSTLPNERTSSMPAESMAIVRLALFLSQTRLARIMMRNRFVIALGKRVMRTLEKKAKSA